MLRHFKKTIDIIITFLIPLVIVTLLLGMAKTVLGLRAAFTSTTVAAGFDIMVTNILSLFIAIELLKSIIDYFEHHRLRITYIIDAAIVFLLREIMIGLYAHKLSAAEIGAIAALLLVAGGVRTLAIRYSPEHRKEGSFHE